ncbi:MAG TPA: diacylglycerol kinase family lipid kinase, partial [Bacillota bacterium]|nr:diacylglycerol kinase family lipid kinase [Bacillota bacterium]
VDIGKFDGRIFLNVSSIGFDAEIIRDLHKVRRFIKGGLAYAISVFLKFMTYKPKILKISIDGIEYKKKLFLAAVCNGTSYGGGMKVNPGGSITDGLFNLILIDPVPRYKIPFLLTKFMKGEHLDLPYVSSFKCHKVYIESNESLAINIDGESTAANAISFYSSPLSLRIFGANK